VGVVVDTNNPSTPEAEVGGLRVLGQPGLCSKFKVGLERERKEERKKKEKEIKKERRKERREGGTEQEREAGRKTLSSIGFINICEFTGDS
jgi:hypothetical protein